MKSVLFLIPTLGGGGAERVLVNLANNLDKSKYDVTVQTVFRAGVNAKYLNPDVNFIEGRIKQFTGNIHVMKLFSPEFLYRLIIKNEYNIVVSFLEGPTARVVSGCPFQNVKTICWIHSQELLYGSFRSKREMELCYEKFDKIVCVAKSVQESFISYCPHVSSCDVIYNIIDDVKIKSLSNEHIDDVNFSPFPNVITIGRNVRQKGFDRLARVHKKLIDAGVNHYVYHIGGGNLESLQQLIKELNISNTFYLLGFKENPYKYLKKADLFVCSSVIEGYSSVVAEALILGIPVVSTKVSGTVELLGDKNQYGLVTENNDEAFYKGCYQILTDKKLYSNYKQLAETRGRQLSKQKFIFEVNEFFDSL